MNSNDTPTIPFIKRIAHYFLHFDFTNWRYQMAIRLFYPAVIWRDDKRGVDFYRDLSVAELGLKEDVSGRYGGTRMYEIRKILKKIKISDQDSIVDFGCGKGATLAVFAEFPFRRITGVELSDRACQVARKNMNVMGLEKVEILNIDARDCVDDLDEFNIFYFYNPFPAIVMETVIKNILTSMDRKHRQVRIIYNYPVDASIIEMTGRFQLMFTYKPFFFGGAINVYTGS